MSVYFPTPHVYHPQRKVRPQLTETLADRVNFMQHLWLMPSLGCP